MGKPNNLLSTSCALLVTGSTQPQIDPRCRQSQHDIVCRSVRREEDHVGPPSRAFEREGSCAPSTCTISIANERRPCRAEGPAALLTQSELRASCTLRQDGPKVQIDLNAVIGRPPPPLPGASVCYLRRARNLTCHFPLCFVSVVGYPRRETDFPK